MRENGISGGCDDSAGKYRPLERVQSTWSLDKQSVFAKGFFDTIEGLPDIRKRIPFHKENGVQTYFGTAVVEGVTYEFISYIHTLKNGGNGEKSERTGGSEMRKNTSWEVSAQIDGTEYRFGVEKDDYDDNSSRFKIIKAITWEVNGTGTVIANSEDQIKAIAKKLTVPLEKAAADDGKPIKFENRIPEIPTIKS